MVGTILTNIFALFAAYSLVASAGLLSEKSGTVNIALEGKMIMGGLVWSLLMSFNVFGFAGMAAPFLAMLVAGLLTILISFILSFFTVNLLGDHVVVGTAINMFMAAFSLLIIYSLIGASTIALPAGGSLSMGWAGTVDTTAIIYLMISAVLIGMIWFVLEKTKWGLRLKASGENPYSLQASGISVNKTRYISNAVAGFLAGLGGAMAMLTMVGGAFSGAVNGMGYVSLAILIFARWNIWGIAGGTVVVSIAMGYARSWGVVGISSIPTEVMQMFPFVIPLVAMVLMKIFYDDKGYGAYGGAPKAAGIPFKKDQR